MSPAKKKLTHIDGKGAARMVDVGAKDVTERRAVARGLLRVSPATIALVRDGATPKGDVLAAARLAGIMAAKRTSDLIPLAHPLPLTHASGVIVTTHSASASRSVISFVPTSTMRAIHAIIGHGNSILDANIKIFLRHPHLRVNRKYHPFL